MLSRLRTCLVLALLAAACASGEGGSSPDRVCQHYVVLAEQGGLILAKDGSDLADCSKDQERTRRKLGDEAYAVHAACLLRAANLVEWMSCDPREGLK